MDSEEISSLIDDGDYSSEILTNFLSLCKSDDGCNKKFQTLISLCARDISSEETEKTFVKNELQSKRESLLLLVLPRNFRKVESRILRLKALFKLVSFAWKNNPVCFLRECKKLVDQLLSLKKIDSQSDYDRDFNIMFFCHGFLQFYTNGWPGERIHHEPEYGIFKEVFDLCTRIAFSYTYATLTSFKCLLMIIKLCKKCPICKYRLCKEICLESQLMTIVMSNWENALPGVRKQVQALFKEWMDDDEQCYELIRFSPHLANANCYSCIDSQSEFKPYTRDCLLGAVLGNVSWKHCFEYYTVAALLKSFGSSVSVVFEEYGTEIVHGLKVSLECHDLAIAGREVYEILLNSLPKEDWKRLLENIVGDVLNDGEEYQRFIQNMFKHWIPSTLSKYPNCLPFEDFEGDKELELFPGHNWYLFKIKWIRIRRKKGLISLDERDMFLRRCLECSDEEVRSDAFGAVCEANDDPQSWEFELVKTFLIQNVNYDQSNLRQNMVNCCITFFLRIRGIILSKMNQGSGIEDSLNFIEWMHQFLIVNLREGSNYQRKVTSLMLYNAVLIYFGTEGGSERGQRKSNTKDRSYLIEEQALKYGKWNFKSESSRKVLLACINDLSELVRNIAADILINYFNFDDDVPGLIQTYQSAKDLCSSNFFHQVESGALLIKTVTVLAYKDGSGQLRKEMLRDSNGKTSVLCDLFEIAEIQSSVLFKDIFKAAAHGSPLHGVLRAIMLLLTDDNSPEFKLMSETQLDVLISLMEKVVSAVIELLSLRKNDLSQNNEFAPSFAEMGESLEEIVRQSEMNYSYDEVFLLPVPHQLVLNCIWFNLKVCCLLASRLITSEVGSRKERITSRCMSILETVLMRCRHKGAMEVAGSALTLATKFLMKNVDVSSPMDRNIPNKILENFFTRFATNYSSTVSRRSAGRSFLVHSIVASDPRPNNPFLKKTVYKLIGIAEENVDMNEASPVDSPQESSLHILSTLVQDSRLNILPHACEIFVVCFNKLTSSIWTVKNAALQLFKSLFVRLLRRNKGEYQNDSELDEYQTTPFEELLFHLPDLYTFIEGRLDALSHSSDIKDHAKLIPILVLLSNLTVTFFKCYSTKYNTTIGIIRTFINKLLSSPLHAVRNISARIKSNFLLLHEIWGEVSSTITCVEHVSLGDFLDQNLLHGSVLFLKFAVARVIKLKNQLLSYSNSLNSNGLISEKSRFFNLYSKFEQEIVNSLTTLVKKPGLSYYLKALSLQVIEELQYQIVFKSGKELFNDLTSTKIEVSRHLGSSILLSKIVESLRGIDDLKKFCLLESANPDITLACLKATSITAPCHLNGTYDLLHSMIRTRNESEIIEQLLRQLCKNELIVGDSEVLNYIFVDLVKNSKFGSSCKWLGLLNCCQTVSDHYRSETLSRVSNVADFYSKYGKLTVDIAKCLSEWSYPSTSNEDMRRTSADCLVYIIKSFFPRIMFLEINKQSLVMEDFNALTDCFGAHIWLTLFQLLQDENLEIRIRACESLPRIHYSSYPPKIGSSCSKLDVPSPFVALNQVIKVSFMVRMMNSKTALKQLWTVFNAGFSGERTRRSVDLSNPFDHGIDNFYKEETLLQEMILEEFEKISQESSFCREFLEKSCYELKAIIEVRSKLADDQSTLEINQIKLVERMLSRTLISS